jgi:hypothetical protein
MADAAMGGIGADGQAHLFFPTGSFSASIESLVKLIFVLRIV